MKSESRRVSFFDTLFFEQTSLVASGALLAAFTIFDVFFGKDMFMLSVQLSIRMQGVALFVPSFILSHIIMYLLVAYCLVVFFLRSDKLAHAGHFAAFFVLMYTSDLLKIIYADPRPSFVTPLLKSATFYCSHDYGKPSGHAMLSAGMVLFIYDDLATNNCRGWWRFLLLGVALVVTVAISVSRLYFGVHAFNQIILGSLWGVFIYFALNAAYGPLLRWVYRPALDAEAAPRERLTFRVTVPFVVLGLVALMLLFWGLNYGLRDQEEEVFAFVVNCYDAVNDSTRTFSTKLTSSGLLGLGVLGLFYGWHFSAFSPALGLQLCYDRVWYWVIVRFLVFVVLLAPGVFAYYPKSGIGVVEVLRPAIIIPLATVLCGRFYLTVLDLIKVPFKRAQVPGVAPSP